MSDRLVVRLARVSPLALSWATAALATPGTGAAPRAAHAPQEPAPSFFDNLFKVYTPRQQCMHHEAPVVWLHLVSDLLIGTAYFSIPVALVYFVRRRTDIAFHWIFWLFAAFILACGTTHFVGVWDLWQPMYKIDGLIKAGTAAISIVTAFLLWPLIPRALALPSPALLEQRVDERTRDLAATNEALLVARAEAEHANRMKDDFLATLSHELRTPLQGVLGWAHVLQNSRSSEHLAEGLAVITRNAQAQHKLIEDLLDMSRITSGRLALDVQSVDLAEVTGAAVASVQPAADQKGIRVQMTLDANAGEITGDPVRLQQVVWNLMSNAVKFTPKGGHIQMVLKRTNALVEIRITDNGEGIEPEFLPHLFQRFRQADSSTRRRQAGLGIGLALVRHIVELHGGTVRAESEGRGRGASFVVLLPLHPVMTPTATSAAPASAAPPSLVLQGLKVLAIDDEQDARRLIETILRSAGATVQTAGSGEEGLAILRRTQPDVLLCDLGLPGEDGFALIRKVRTLSERQGGLTPAVAVTALARPEDRMKALLAGFQVHLAKPFEPDELVATVAGLAGLRRPDGPPRGEHT